MEQTSPLGQDTDNGEAVRVWGRAMWGSRPLLSIFLGT